MRNHKSKKKWPILDNRTDQLSKRRPGKATHSFVFDTLAVTSSVNSGYGRPEVVCHLLSCVHASITSKSDPKEFELSEKFQRCAVVREGGNRRSIPAKGLDQVASV